MIKLSQASLGLQEKQAVSRVIDNLYLGMGQEVKAFEEELQAFISPHVHVACVNTGTSALHSAVQACGIGPGDEVIIPSITYVASFQAVSATGATPIACDINMETGCIDVESAAKRITPKTKAIMPVHYGGGLGDLEGIYKLAKTYNVRVIEDAAHSFGGYYKTQRIGARGDIICFSFDGIKNITCGEGGAVVSQDQTIIEKVRDLRLLGVMKDTEKRYLGQRSWDFEVVGQGWRYHMSNINAAIGREQLKKSDEFWQIRKKLYQQYMDLLPLQFLEIFKLDIHQTNPHMLPIKIKNGKRDALKDFLAENRIETGIHYKPNHLLARYKSSGCPNAELLYAQLLTLPLHCNLTSADVSHVCETITQFFEKDAS